MSIRRQYSLPNCTLILEGFNHWGDGLGDRTGMLDLRPQALTIVSNAECRIMGYSQVLTGGRDFLENLVSTVSQYAQGFLSGIPHPEPLDQKPPRVHLEKLDLNRHRLTLEMEPALPPGGTLSASDLTTASPPPASTNSLQVDLTTVQLFDLVEAIDQFFADTQTLPDLTLQLQPVSRRYLKATTPFVERATPAAVGVSSLAIAATLLFFLPIPEVKRPTPPEPVKSSQTETEGTATPVSTSPTPEPGVSASPSPEVANLEASLNQAPAITDPAQINELNSLLYASVDRAWTNRDSVVQELVYRVSVSQTGEILGYKPVNAAAQSWNDQQNPLFNLLYIPTAENPIPNEPIAQFKLVLTPRGVVQVSPWEGWKESAIPATKGAEITDSQVLESLNEELYDKIWTNWKTKPTFEKSLEFRVGINQDGEIAQYEPLNQPAFDFVDQTPLPQLRQAPPTPVAGQATPTSSPEPLALYKVVFRPSGALEVSPWRGYE